MTYDDYQHLVVTIDDGVAVVRLNRPDKLNAFNSVMGRELLRLPGELREDPSVRVVVVTGAGRGFCAGVDVSEERTASADNPFHRPPMDELGYTGRLPLAWREIDKPTIGAINGVAAGGGLSLAMMLDLRFMAESARLVPTFITRGISPEVGLSWFVARAIGFSRAFAWLATGEQLSAAQALELGLVTRVVSDDALLAATRDFARQLAEGPPLALRLTRRVLSHALEHSLRDHLPYEAQCVSITNQTEDAKEGRAALRERRKPNFVGR